MMPVPVLYIAAILLFIAPLPLPYGYYTLVRIVTTGIFIWVSIIEYKKNSSSILTWGFILGAILFNPFIPIHLNREIWAPIDIITGAMLLGVKKRVLD